MIAFLLWLLATLDSAFIGYREAAGRNALIDKKLYYRQALIKGAFFGQLAVLVVAIITGLALLVSNDSRALFFDLQLIGARMLSVYVPYAAIILITLVVRTFPSVDIRCITSVLVFGPFTVIRPFVVLAGAIWGVLAAPSAVTIVLVLLIVSLMLSLEGVLGALRTWRTS
jgi:hypothetical protein